MTDSIRLVACDIDGTLVDRSGEASPRVAAAIAEARAAGITVIAATGRPWQFTVDLCRELSLLPAAVVSNGAAILDVATGQVDAAGTFAVAAVQGLMDRIRAAEPGVFFAIDGMELVAHEPGFAGEEAIFADFAVADLAPLLAQGVIKLILRVPGEDDGAALAARLDEEIVEGAAHVSHVGGSWVELTTDGFTKAAGLQRVIDRMGITLQEVAVLGDNLNDVPMFHWAGLAVAMGNASDEVRSHAHLVVPSVDDDGAAEFLEGLARSR